MNNANIIIVAFVMAVSAIIYGCADVGDAAILSDVSIAHQGMSNRPADADFVKMCKAFRLKKANVKYYFAKVKKITRSILHDKYELYPCYSDGQAKLDNKIVQWSIHSGGIGFIRFDDTEQVYACNENVCKSIKGLY